MLDKGAEIIRQAKEERKNTKMDKISYRLVYNRQNTLNRQGTALVQVEAYLNQRKIYLKTNVYLKPECWIREGAQVINYFS